MLYADERPQTFDGVKEQEFIIKNLQAQARKGVFFNSIILCGKYGTGKTTVARIIARAANCENRDGDGNPCMECASCRSILDRSGTDVIEIDGASNNGVDAARRLMKEINYVPMSRYRVIIIDECHRISSSAWDALLKTLEEPPEHVMFILCTTDETALPETIRSRAPVYRFESIPAKMLGRHAKETAEKYGIKISDNALNLLASYADGSMRNVLSLLEQVSMQGSDITEGDVEMLLGINHYTFTVGFLSHMLSGNLDICMEQLNSLVSEGRSVRLFAKDLMRTSVDMVLQKTGITPDNGNMEYLKLLGEETAKYGMAQLNSLAELTAGLEKGMRKESDTYAMYGGIISIVRKLHKDIPCTDMEESKAAIQPETAAAVIPEELTGKKAPAALPGPLPETDDSGPDQDEYDTETAAGDGINRNVSVLPDLEQALMDFMPDLEREPQGRFDAGVYDGNNYIESDDTFDHADDTDNAGSLENDDWLHDGQGQYGGYSQPSDGNRFMMDDSTEPAGTSGVNDDPYDGADRQEHGGDDCHMGGAETAGGDDDFDRRWEEARQDNTRNNGFPVLPFNSQTPGKGFNIFGLPFGAGVPDMGGKKSFP